MMNDVGGLAPQGWEPVDRRVYFHLGGSGKVSTAFVLSVGDRSFSICG